MHLRTGKTLAIVLLSLSGLAASASASNLLVNGNFSGPVNNDASGAYSDGISEPQDNLPFGWILDGPATVSDVSVVAASSTYGLGDPLGSADYIAFAGGGGGQDCLTETIPTIIGDTYQISFRVAVTGSVATDAAQLTFEWAANDGNSCNNNGAVCDNGEADQLLYSSNFYSNIPPYASVTDQPFEEYTYKVTANLSDTKIYFHGIDLINGSNANQPANSALLVADASIQNLSSAPEPDSLLLISLGLAIVVGLRIRKQKQKKLAFAD